MVVPSDGNTALVFPGACEGGGIPVDDGLVFDDNGQTTRLPWLKKDEDGKHKHARRERTLMCFVVYRRTSLASMPADTSALSGSPLALPRRSLQCC